MPRALAIAALVLVLGTGVTQAELRTWKAAAGGFTTDAEFVELKPGDVVRLRTKDGRELLVPLAQLSAEDQAYARRKAGASPIAKVQRAADLCRQPDDALIVYKLFHDDPKTSPEDRAVAAARMAELKDLSAKKMVRLNKKWVTADEAAVVRNKADELMRQGMELIKIGQEDAFRKKFADAAALEPETIRADFISGLVYTMLLRCEKALPCFQKCLLVDPDNVAVLNNVAITAADKGDWNAAAVAWRKALTVQPDQRVVHNVGRFLEQSLRANVAIPKAARDVLALPYAELVASGKFQPTDDELGWFVLLLEASDLDFQLDKEEKNARPSAKPAATEDGPVVGGGTGIVVQAGYVLTNAHVATDDGVFDIQLPDKRLLRAKRIDADEQLDLALLHCPELTAPAASFAPYTVPRGTDVMLLGYPEMFNLGVSLKATRGSISSLPDAEVKDRYLYDAVTNSGNSGGPVCDDKANVVAVHSVAFNAASRYGGGVPSWVALTFLQRTLPDFKPAQPHTESVAWPEVDEKVSSSTVLIWIRKKNGKPTANMGSDVLELPFCVFCSGVGQLGCNSCRAGTAVQNGRAVTCRNCGGDGRVNCSVCKGVGIDAGISMVKSAVAKSGPVASTPVTSGPRPASPPSTTAKGTIAVFGIAPGAKELGYDMRVAHVPSIRLSDTELAQHIATLQGTEWGKAAISAKRLADSVVDPRYREQVAQRLERWVNSSTAWGTHAACIRALETWHRPNSIAPIGNSLRSYNWIVRHQAAYTLAFIGDPACLPPLVAHLRKPDDVEQKTSEFSVAAERNMVKSALILFGPNARPEIENLRNDGDPAVQAAAEEILKAYDAQAAGQNQAQQNTAAGLLGAGP